jgi:hypothetical protein
MGPVQGDAFGGLAFFGMQFGEVADRRVVGPGHRHDAVDEHVGLFERSDLGLQPLVRHRRDPGRLARARLRRDRQVHVGRVFEKRFFEHAAECGAQARGRRLGQGDAVPADVGVGQHGDHGRGFRQQRCGALALRLQRQPVGAGHVDVFGAEAGGVGLQATRAALAQPPALGDVDNKSRHGMQGAGLAAL